MSWLFVIMLIIAIPSNVIADDYGCDKQDTFISPKPYLSLAGTACFIQCILHFSIVQHRDWRDSRGLEKDIGSIFYYCFVISWSILWCALGGIIMVDLSSDCLHSPIGIMIFAFFNK